MIKLSQNSDENGWSVIILRLNSGIGRHIRIHMREDLRGTGLTSEFLDQGKIKESVMES
jgi:hypothetical protein